MTVQGHEPDARARRRKELGSTKEVSQTRANRMEIDMNVKKTTDIRKRKSDASEPKDQLTDQELDGAAGGKLRIISEHVERQSQVVQKITS